MCHQVDDFLDLGRMNTYKCILCHLPRVFQYVFDAFILDHFSICSTGINQNSCNLGQVSIKIHSKIQPKPFQKYASIRTIYEVYNYMLDIQNSRRQPGPASRRGPRGGPGASVPGRAAAVWYCVYVLYVFVQILYILVYVCLSFSMSLMRVFYIISQFVQLESIKTLINLGRFQ